MQKEIKLLKKKQPHTNKVLSGNRKCNKRSEWKGAKKVYNEKSLVPNDVGMN